MDIPHSWTQLEVERLRGIILVIGAPDVGKTTFSQYLHGRLSSVAGSVAYLDGDPGQSTLGPPTTMTIALTQGGQGALLLQERRWQSFVGAVSPKGHMLPLLVSASRLVRAAQDAGAKAIVYDTTGLVDPAQGGLVLKLAKVELLRPTALFAIQRGQELEPLLVPLRRSGRVRVIDLTSVSVARRRDIQVRQAHRARQFAAYFRPEGAPKPSMMDVDWSRLAVFPDSGLLPGRLVAMEDAQGFALGLGIVSRNVACDKRATLYTPLRSLDGVDALRLGDLMLDPQTFQDRRLDTTTGG
jgi:polynucleotide 5'-hydroxyl-kinase GRC3/NOL9